MGRERDYHREGNGRGRMVITPRAGRLDKGQRAVYPYNDYPNILKHKIPMKTITISKGEKFSIFFIRIFE